MSEENLRKRKATDPRDNFFDFLRDRLDKEPHIYNSFMLAWINFRLASGYSKTKFLLKSEQHFANYKDIFYRLKTCFDEIYKNEEEDREAIANYFSSNSMNPPNQQATELGSTSNDESTQPSKFSRLG